MTQPIDYLAEFGKFYGGKKGASSIVENFNGDIKAKVQARRAIRRQAKVPRHQKLDDAVLQKLATAYEAMANDNLYGFFETNRGSVLNSLPADCLEAKFLDNLQPVKVDGNDNHNLVAKLHSEYLGLKTLNQAYDEKKVQSPQYVMPIAEAAYNQIKADLDRNQFLKDDTKELMAEAQAELVGQSEIMARQIGKQLEGQAKKAVIETIGGMEKAKGKDHYTRAQYARNNLIYNDNTGYVIEMAGQCLPKPRRN